MKTLTKLTITLLTSLTLSTAFAQGFNMKSAEVMDENHDGMITKEEYMKHSNDMASFDKMDTNKDGMLDAKEIRVGFNQK
ncbi:MAG: EF-hand domain-containing protein [Candidatus Contendobacter sp.]|nr:EF-hand domain-containing protein [Candidatus Contendobacter sp.]